MNVQEFASKNRALSCWLVRRYLSLQESIVLGRLNFLKKLGQALGAYCHGHIDRKELNRRHREVRAEWSRTSKAAKQTGGGYGTHPTGVSQETRRKSETLSLRFHPHPTLRPPDPRSLSIIVDSPSTIPTSRWLYHGSTWAKSSGGFGISLLLPRTGAPNVIRLLTRQKEIHCQIQRRDMD